MIDNLPNGWKEEKIGNIINLTIGKTPSRKKSEYFTGENLWVSIADIRSINLTDTKEKITEQAIKDSNIKKVKAGTLIMSYKLSIGKMAFASEDLYTNEAIAALNIITDDLDKKFLYYYLLNADLEKTTDRAVKGKTLNKAKIEQIPIQFPPLQQQEKIVKVLDLTSNLIEKQKELLEKYDLFLKSKFIEMFGTIKDNPNNFDIEPIKNFGKIITGNTPLRQEEEFYNDNFIEWIKTDNIHTNQQYVSTASEYLSEKGMKKGRILEKGGLLITCIAGSLKSIGNVAMTDRKITFNQQINAIQPFENVDSLFLFWQLKINKNYVQTFSTSSMKKIITKGEFQEIEFLKPPFELQKKFSQIASKMSSIIEKENQKLKQMNDLHNSMMNKAFKGEIK